MSQAALKSIKPILPPYPGLQGCTEAEELRRQAREGLALRLERQVFTPAMSAEERAEQHSIYHERLAFELDVIERMKFPGYFLIVSDFIKWSKANGVPVGVTNDASPRAAAGFGISTPEQAGAVAHMADGVVVGSALVRMIGEGATDAQLEAFARALRDKMNLREKMDS